jgi:replicative DNA helicase
VSQAHVKLTAESLAKHGRQDVVPEDLSSLRRHVDDAPGTGFSELDRLHPVLVPGCVQLVAGAPGVGVTAWLLAVASHVAGRERRGVVYISSESREAVLRRLVLRHTTVDWPRLRARALDDHDQQTVERVTAEVHQWPLGIIEASDPTTAVQAAGAALAELAEWRPGLVVIDDPTGPTRPEPQVPDPAAWLQVAQRLAREASVPVLVAARATPVADNGRDLTRPTLYTRLGSWAKMQRYCDAVWVVHRDEHYDLDSPQRGLGEIHLMLNRLELPRLVLQLGFLEDRASWFDLAKPTSGEASPSDAWRPQ